LVPAAITLDHNTIVSHAAAGGSDWTSNLVYDLSGRVVPSTRYETRQPEA
jgi:hypothetical protein